MIIDIVYGEAVKKNVQEKAKTVLALIAHLSFWWSKTCYKSFSSI